MEVAAILLVGGGTSELSDGQRPGVPATLFGGAPLALQPLMGIPVAYRVAGMLREQSVGRALILSEHALPPQAEVARPAMAGVEWQQVEPGQLWRSAQNTFAEVAQGSADEILVLRLGAYAPLDVQELLAHHYEHRCRITSVVTPDGEPLQMFAISSNRRNDAAYLLRNALEKTRTECKEYVHRGYHNRLRNCADFRGLTVDALFQKVPLQPLGHEIRPGVWVASGARIHPTARVVPPVYIGERARVMPGALITRCAVLEHHARVAPQAIVENSTLMACTRLGSGLELRHSVAAGNRIAHLRHQVEVEVSDARILRPLAPPAYGNMMERLRSLAPLPSLLSFFHSLSGSRVAASPSSLGDSLEQSARHGAREEEFQDEFTGNVAVVRRYGNE